MAKIDFAWTYRDDDHPDVSFRLYEDRELAVDNIGELKFSLIMDGKPTGTYDYYVTAVDEKTHLESLPSNTVAVNFTLPAAPAGFTASLLP